MLTPVSTQPPEERIKLTSIVDMGLRFLGERDPALLLQGMADMAREMMSAQHAAMGILEEGGQPNNGWIFFSGLSTAMELIPTQFLRPGIVANMLLESRPFRLREDASEFPVY